MIQFKIDPTQHEIIQLSLLTTAKKMRDAGLTQFADLVEDTYNEISIQNEFDKSSDIEKS